MAGYVGRDAVIVGAVRTPIGKGKAGGALHDVLPVDLLAHSLKELANRTGIDDPTGAYAHAAEPGYDDSAWRTVTVPHDWSIELDPTPAGGTDAGPGFRPSRREPRPDQGSGWGLILVDRIADRWGVERGELTHVWFEIELRRLLK